ncbi:TPA: hypothetical protein GJ769_12590 [Legionella pneumophila]|nr:hypothetical protein [Legionella pneumophila]HAT1987737.1 hypothetical protein [Legionella pneumophila]HAT7910040.1 hypothetical protein [Legionella pneumophila]HAT7913537.1 hypothetical protein [Legionella pneumophila]HAT7916618.1 hypothetical protein [Legionella pneumophila]HAT7983340.1 hypothetical protein [Legionella pneumophila]
MNSTSKSLIIALGASLSVATNASASSQGALFQANALPHGYQNTPKLASNSVDQSNPTTPNTGGTEVKPPQGKCGAGKCSSNKKGTGKCGTGKCGANQGNMVEGEAKPTESKE